MEKFAVRVPEAAEMLNISKSQLYKLIHSDPTFPRKKLGETIVIPLASLEAWLNGERK